MSELKNIVDRLNLSNIIYYGYCGSSVYLIPSAKDIDIEVVTDSNDDKKYKRDEPTNADVFILSSGLIKRILSGEAYFATQGAFFANLNAEKAKALSLDLFDADTETIKAAASLDFARTSMSPYLVVADKNGEYVSTRQSKGLYHPLALMYKLKNKSYELSTDQLANITKAHDKILPEEIINELYAFYAIII